MHAADVALGAQRHACYGKIAQTIYNCETMTGGWYNSHCEHSSMDYCVLHIQHYIGIKPEVAQRMSRTTDGEGALISYLLLCIHWTCTKHTAPFMV